jgi:hypothetical protein
LSAQQVFRGPYLLAPCPELGLPHVQIEAIIETHNFCIQSFAIRGHLGHRICTQKSCCLGLREYLSGWVDLVGKPPSPRSFTCWCFGPWVVWSLFTLCLDLWRASWSSHKVLDELYPKVLLKVLKSYVNNILQKPHASANLSYQGVSTIS